MSNKKREISYKFVIGKMEIELSEPTIKAFEKFWETSFLSFFLERLKPKIIKDLKFLIKNKKYEIIINNEGKNEKV